MDSDTYFTLIICFLFVLYGASNLYIIIFLREKENYIIGVFEFITIFMGNIKNYINLNKKYRKSFISSGNNLLFHSCVSILHIISPFLILISIISWVMSIGLY